MGGSFLDLLDDGPVTDMQAVEGPYCGNTATMFSAQIVQPTNKKLLAQLHDKQPVIPARPPYIKAQNYNPAMGLKVGISGLLPLTTYR